MMHAIYVTPGGSVSAFSSPDTAVDIAAMSCRSRHSLVNYLAKETERSMHSLAYSASLH